MSAQSYRNGRAPSHARRRHYAKLRGSRYAASYRSRKDALPIASLVFLTSIFSLYILFAVSSSSIASSLSANASRLLSLKAPVFTHHPAKSFTNTLITDKPNDLLLLPLLNNSSSSFRSTSSLSLTPAVRSGGDYGDLCSYAFKSRFNLLYLIPGIVICFVGLAIVTDDYFVAALEQICQQLDLSEDVAGATFMAAGSSTPEFFASLIGVFFTKDSVGIGTIVGSAVFNILVIIGLSAALSGAELKLDWRPLTRDSAFYVLSIVLLFTFTMGPTKGRIDWWEGAILVVTYIVYVLFMAFVNRHYMKAAASLRWFGVTPDNNAATPDIEQAVSTNIEDATASPEQPSLSATRGALSYVTINEDGTKRYRDLNPRTRLKVAQFAVLAATRLASSSSSKSDDEDDIASPPVKLNEPKPRYDADGVDIVDMPAADDRPPPGGDGDRDDDAEGGRKKKKNKNKSSGVSGAAEVEEDGVDGPTFLGVELPSSIIGWVFFPITLLWKCLYRLTIVDCSKPNRARWWPVTFICSIVWISGISYLMVEASRIAGCLVGIPSTIMGLTVLAAGTSVPDALASISVARDGAGDMAVSNAIGSNVFDILLGLGFPWMLGNWILGAGSIKINTESVAEVVVPIIILFVIMVAFVTLLLLFKWKMNKLFGYSLFLLYFLFVAYTLLENYVFKF